MGRRFEEQGGRRRRYWDGEEGKESDIVCKRNRGFTDRAIL